MALGLSLAMKTHMIVPKAQQRVKSASPYVSGERCGRGQVKGEGAKADAYFGYFD